MPCPKDDVIIIDLSSDDDQKKTKCIYPSSKFGSTACVDEVEDHAVAYFVGQKKSLSDGKKDDIGEGSHVLKQYMEITGINSKKDAIDHLGRCYGDLNQAIAAYFGEGPSHVNIVASTCTEKTKIEQTNESTLLTLNTSTSCAEGGTNTMVIKHHENSPEWHETIKTCRKLNVQFIDESFPPNTTSIDGRKIQSFDATSKVNYHNSSMSPSRSIRCHCGLIATIKTVQKDGPNYGRFFLSCGRKRSRKMRMDTTKRKRDDKDDDKEQNDKNDDIIMIDIENDKNNESGQKQIKSKVSTSKTNDQSQCSFFKWDDQHKQTNYASSRSAWVHQLSWIRYESRPEYSLTYPRGQYSPSHICQGILGDCWFLSALAVVAEKPYLIQKLIPHFEYNDAGCYEVFFCLDGAWSSVLVDSLLPSVPSKQRKKVSQSATSGFILNDDTEKSKEKEEQCGTNDEYGNSNMQPAFASSRVTWPAIVEKAYAKVHGSYARLSGGYISEAFYDLTGSPVERIRFHQEYDYDELFARLLSFVSSGFLMGIATNRGGDGLVPCHAYSLLGVYEVHDVIEGSQGKLTNFVSQKKSKSDDEVVVLENPGAVGIAQERKTIRLVCIRNPWGVREWKGKWSANSEMWTRKIRKQLGRETALKQGNGTFFMSYEDMIQRFDHLDIAKCKEGWSRATLGGVVKVDESGDALKSSALVYHFQVKQKTWSFISFVQKKKRANTSTRFWYTDVSMIILQRKHSRDAWECCKCVLQGVKRACDVEMFLDPGYQYCAVPISYLSGKQALEFGSNEKKRKSSLIRITSYASNPVELHARPRASIGEGILINFIHRHLIKNRKTVSYALGPSAALTATSCNGCVYFCGFNAGDKGLMMRLSIETSQGTEVACGQNSDTHIIPPKSQSIILILANDGRHHTQTINFRYQADVCQAIMYSQQKFAYKGVRSNVDITLAGELVCNEVGTQGGYRNGKGTLDEVLWESVGISSDR